MKSWIDVDEERLTGNYRTLQEIAGPGTEVLAVVKANAYGHDAECCSGALVAAGARWLGVTDSREGARVRAALAAPQAEPQAARHPEPELLIMCGFEPVDIGRIQENRLTPTAWTLEQIEWLRDTGVRVHVEIDTGMSRQGARPGAELSALLDCMEDAGVGLGGLFTHFASAEVSDGEKTRLQQERFQQAVSQVRDRGLQLGWVHAGNSSWLDTCDIARDLGWLRELAASVGAKPMVRAGIALYGYVLPIEGDGEGRLRARLQPAMTWRTRVLSVHDLQPGDSVGYGGTFTARGPMRVALLPVGYADGLRRELSGRYELPGGWVLVRGTRRPNVHAPIVGRISMNLTIVDITGVEGVDTGDEVVLLGDGITADDHARIAGTIAYEILCGVRER